MLRVFVSSPKLFSFLNVFEVQAYGLFFVIGLVCLVALLLVDAPKKLGVAPEHLLDVVLFSLIAGLFGARLLYVFEFPELLNQSIFTILDPRAGGLSLLGGLVAAPVAGFIACRRIGISGLAFLDLAALYAPVFDLFGRLGCFFGGCCYGMAAKTLCSVVYVDSSVAAPVGIDLFPVQLLAAVTFFGLFCFLLVSKFILHKARINPLGCITALYFVGAGFIRFFLDFFRADRSATLLELKFGGLAVLITWYQIISLMISLLALASFLGFLLRAKSLSSEFA